MKALITGGSGFVGFNLYKYLESNGHNVGVLKRPTSDFMRFKEIEGNPKFLLGDLNDENSLRTSINEFKPDIIFHLATYGAFPKTETDFLKMLETDVGGVYRLISASGGIPIINTGSSSEYGIKDLEMSEDNRCDPALDYGIAKLAQTLYCSKSKIPTLRLFSVYGPYEDNRRLIPTLMNASFSGKSIDLINSIRDFVYVDDVVKAYMITAEKYSQVRGEIINIGSGVQTSVETLAEKVNKFTGKTLQVRWNFMPVQHEPSKWVADIKKAGEVLGWKPDNYINEGISKLYTWHKSMRDGI